MPFMPLRWCWLLLALPALAAGAADSRLSPDDGSAASLPTGAVIVDRADIEQSGATSLTDVLDSVAGLDARRRLGLDGSRADLDLLGQGAAANSNTLILLNGQRYGNADGSAPDIDALPLTAIERIEILPGAGSALYGNGAVGGAINIITRSDYGNSVRAQASAGDFSRRGGEAWGSRQSGNRGAALAAEILNTAGYRDNQQLQRDNGFVDLRADAGPAEFAVTGTMEEREQELPGGRNASFVTTSTDFANQAEGADTPDDKAEQDSFRLGPSVRLRLDEQARLHLDASRRHRSRRTFRPSNGTYSETDVDTYTLNPRLVLTGETGPVDHHFNLGWDQYRYEYKRRSAATPGGLSNPAARARVEREEDGWYLHDRMRLGERWALSLGGRELHSRTRSQDLVSRAGADRDEALYEGGVRYFPVPTFSLFAGAQRSARLPHADEIRRASPSGFRAQTGRTYTAGAGWREGKEHSRLTFWRARLDHEIAADASGNPVNLGDPTRRKGVSLNSRFELDDNIMLTVNASYQRAAFQGGPNENNQVPLVPRRNLYLRADWRPRDWFRASLTHRYTGQRHLDKDAANRSRQLDSHRRSSLRVRAEYRDLFLEGGVYNLANNRAADYGVRTGANSYDAWPLPARHLRLTLGFKL